MASIHTCTAPSQKGPRNNSSPQSIQSRAGSKPKTRNVIRPTEIVPPEEAGDRNFRVVRDDDEDSQDSSDEDGESIELSEEEEDCEDEENDEEDDDDIETIYLSDSDEPNQKITKTDKKSPDPSSRTTQRTNRRVSQPQYVYTETQTASQWIVARQQTQGSLRDVVVSRGAATSRRQTIQHGEQASRPSNRRDRGNSMRLNMSLDVNVSFSGLVTGRNLSLAGGQLSYSWTSRRGQQ